MALFVFVVLLCVGAQAQRTIEESNQITGRLELFKGMDIDDDNRVSFQEVITAMKELTVII